MKIHTSNNKKNTIIIASTILIVGIGGISTYLYYHNKTSNPASNDIVNLRPATDDEKKAGNSAKQNTVTPSDKGDTTGSDSTPVPTPEGSSKAKVNAEITSANQNNPLFQIRTLIHVVTGEGLCSLSMSGPGGKSYTSSANVQALPSSSTCQGFDVPISSLAPGTWKIDIKFSNDQYEATATKEITIQ